MSGPFRAVDGDFDHGSDPLPPVRSEQFVRCLVVGVTERNGKAWDLVCVAEGLGRIEVDPFVGCALPELSDDERRALIGQSFDMSDYWKHASGVYLCHAFTPNPEHQRSAT